MSKVYLISPSQKALTEMFIVSTYGYQVLNYLTIEAGACYFHISAYYYIGKQVFETTISKFIKTAIYRCIVQYRVCIYVAGQSIFNLRGLCRDKPWMAIGLSFLAFRDPP